MRAGSGGVARSQTPPELTSLLASTPPPRAPRPRHAVGARPGGRQPASERVSSGGATVSKKHANFILNEGEATAADVEALVHHVQAAVERVHGVRLVPEVRVIGEAA